MRRQCRHYRSVQQRDVDFRAQLTKIANTDFDALFIPANYKEVGLVANQARNMGITQQLIGPDAWQVDDLFALAADAMEGGYFVSGTDITSDALKAFSEKFHEKFDYYPSELAQTPSSRPMHFL